jgi:hypothetical protein
LPYGNYYFNTQAEIDAFEINYPGCSDLNGNVSINSLYPEYDIENLSGLSNISSIEGSLHFYNNKNLIDLTGMENLSFVSYTSGLV